MMMNHDDGEVLVDDEHVDVEDRTNNKSNSKKILSTTNARSTRNIPSSASSLDDNDNDSSSASKPQQQNEQQLSFWSRAVKSTHGPVLQVLQATARFSALHPWTTIVLVTLCTLICVITGVFLVGMNLNTNRQFTPAHSLPLLHSNWISDTFTGQPRAFSMILHAHGANVIDHVDRVLTAVDTITSLPGYDAMCAANEDETQPRECRIYSVGGFWNHSRDVFHQDTQSSNRTAIGLALTQTLFADGSPAPLPLLYGKAVTNANNSRLVESVASYTATIFFTPGRPGRNFEPRALAAALALADEWRNDDDTGIVLEVGADSSLTAEFARAILQDLYLVPLIFVVMAVFTAIAFGPQRRGLGVGAVVAVLLSMASGFGLLFACSVPFTSMTQILPFIIFGIGLDDAFILMGAYKRTDPAMEAVERIAETIDEVGLSITLTTLTSAVAFGLGCLSSVFGVYWLCLYAFPTILFVFAYQLTFFVACIVLDERRIQARRRDVCLCYIMEKNEEEEEDSMTRENTEHFADRLMGGFAKVLLFTPVKIIVIVGFAALFGFSCRSALRFEEEFNVQEALPRDSYVLSFSEAVEDYRDRGPLQANIYFRNIDQSLPEVQQDMREYIAAVQESPYFGELDAFWLDFFNIHNAFETDANKTFAERIDDFLSVSLYHDLFDRDINRTYVEIDGVRRTVEVMGSRVRIQVNVDLKDSQEQINVLKEQRAISEDFYGNKDREELAFFTYDGTYKIWEFLAIAKRELLFTAAIGVVAVSLVALVFIPHWSASLIVFPLICILYIDLLGIMQWAGLHINPVSYVSLAMSIGLLVDFVMHILFRFYESSGTRSEKMVEMMSTMGSSILLGGTTTFLGTIPLMFSSSDVFQTVFFTFLGIVTLGMGHGLVLVPVLLSMFGPEVQISMRSASSIIRKSNNTAAASTDSAQSSEPTNVGGNGGISPQLPEFVKVIQTEEGQVMYHI